jgi:hypothetical protein
LVALLENLLLLVNEFAMYAPAARSSLEHRASNAFEDNSVLWKQT